MDVPGRLSTVSPPVWLVRRAKTAVLCGFLIGFGVASMAASSQRMLCDFSSSSGVAWSNIDDVVMGGHSSSHFSTNADGTATFSGTVSLADGGGFASARGRLADAADLRAYRALVLRVRGDGKRYSMRLRNDARGGGIAYAATCEAPTDGWHPVELPFAQFVPKYRGRRVPDAPPLDLANIQQLGLLIADKQAGRFQLDLDWIAAR
mgnify:CR=1 FL=1